MHESRHMSAVTEILNLVGIPHLRAPQSPSDKLSLVKLVLPEGKP